MAYEYFTYDSDYDVEAFAVEEAYWKPEKDKLFGLPVIKLEQMEEMYAPDQYEVFIAITYVQLNRARKRLFELCKKNGYYCASYISSKTYIGDSVAIGENVFVFENNVLQYHVMIGDDTILWSGNHIGHRTKIGKHCWITSHDVVSGFCSVGNGCFLGVNATVGDCVSVDDDVVLGAGAVTVKNLDEAGMVYVGGPARKIRSSYEQFGASEL